MKFFIKVSLLLFLNSFFGLHPAASRRTFLNWKKDGGTELKGEVVKRLKIETLETGDFDNRTWALYLWNAIERDDSDAVEQLIESIKPAERKDYLNQGIVRKESDCVWNFVSYAAMRGNTEAVTFLCDQGADPTQKIVRQNANSWWQPLYFAIYSNCPDTAQALIDRPEVDPNVWVHRNEKSKWFAPLAIAVEHKCLKVIPVLYNADSLFSEGVCVIKEGKEKRESVVWNAFCYGPRGDSEESDEEPVEDFPVRAACLEAAVGKYAMDLEGKKEQ